MTLTYARWSPLEKAGDVAVHVRAHLSSVASETDDPDEFADEVNIEVTADGDGVNVVGALDRDPVADYLSTDWTPERDIAANPLSVRSILEEEM